MYLEHCYLIYYSNEHHGQVGRNVYFDLQGHGFNYIDSKQDVS